jgi:hypothetical protein
MIDPGFVNMGGLAGALNSERKSDLDYEHLYEGDSPPDEVSLAPIPVEGTPELDAQPPVEPQPRPRKLRNRQK